MQYHLFLALQKGGASVDRMLLWGRLPGATGVYHRPRRRSAQELTIAHYQAVATQIEYPNRT